MQGFAGCASEIACASDTQSSCRLSRKRIGPSGRASGIVPSGDLAGEVPWQDMVEPVLPFWENGFQIHSHANGDEAVDMTLDTNDNKNNRYAGSERKVSIGQGIVSQLHRPGFWPLFRR